MKLSFHRPLFLVLIAFALLPCHPAEAKEIEFRLVLTDAEAFSQNFQHYIYQPKESVQGRDITVAEKPFLSRADIATIEVTALSKEGLGKPILNILFTKEAYEKFQEIKEQYSGYEVAVLYSGKVLTVLKIPSTKVRGFVFYSSEIQTDEDAKAFCESLGIKPLFRSQKKSNEKPSLPSEPTPQKFKALVS